MGLTNNEQLLKPISDAAPAGENLEYDPAFLALERAAQGKPEQRMGNAVVPGEPPEWGGVLSQATALLARTKDLRVAVHLTNALLNRGGLEGMADGLTVVSGLLEGFWPGVFPELDREENDDPTMRITALAALTAPALLHTLRNTQVVRAQALGAVVFRDLSTAQGDAALDASTIEGVFQSVELTSLEAAVGWLGTCIERVSQVDKIFEERTGSRGPDLTPLLKIFRDALNFARPRLENRRPAGAPAATEADVNGTESVTAVAASPRSALAGEVSSREDVVRAIDKICAYYARFEPSSPLPLMLQRCKKLVPMGFLEILKEIAPNGLPELETVVGKTGE